MSGTWTKPNSQPKLTNWAKFKPKSKFLQMVIPLLLLLTFPLSTSSPMIADWSPVKDVTNQHAKDLRAFTASEHDKANKDSLEISQEFTQNGSGPGARSSHAITIVGTKAYAFGGEFTPRVPVDNKMYSFDLTTETWSVLDCIGNIPPPRVGVTMVSIANTIYVFGGRDYDHKELNEFYSFDTLTNEWTLLSSGEVGPPHRSYHSMAADEKQIYIFGGCGNSGRLNDLWAYDAVANQWAQLPSPGDTIRPRGGPGLAVTGGKIWVVYGFAGMEVDDVHYFDLKTEKWSLVETTGEKPSARSVFSAFAIGKYVVMYGGEVDPSDLGHLGAGKFSADVYALDTESLVWTKLDDASDQHPGPRGWCAFSAGEMDGKSGLLVYGGNSPTNDRLGDLHFFFPSL